MQEITPSKSIVIYTTLHDCAIFKCASRIKEIAFSAMALDSVDNSLSGMEIR